MEYRTWRPPDAIALLAASLQLLFAHEAAAQNAAQPQQSASSRPSCSLLALQQNLQVRAEVGPNTGTLLVQSPTPDTHFVSSERRVGCSAADLLQLGFELKTAERYGPQHSTNGAFEEILYFQRGDLLVKCYGEFALSSRSDSAQVTSSRSACQQIVQSRLRPVGRTANSPES